MFFLFASEGTRDPLAGGADLDVLRAHAESIGPSGWLIRCSYGPKTHHHTAPIVWRDQKRAPCPTCFGLSGRHWPECEYSRPDNLMNGEPHA